MDAQWPATAAWCRKELARSRCQFGLAVALLSAAIVVVCCGARSNGQDVSVAPVALVSQEQVHEEHAAEAELKNFWHSLDTSARQTRHKVERIQAARLAAHIGTAYQSERSAQVNIILCVLICWIRENAHLRRQTCTDSPAELSRFLDRLVVSTMF